jgi:hypothetical protein
MPDNTGRLTPEDKKKIEAWFGTHWHNYLCPFCKSDKWNYADHIVVTPRSASDGLVTGSMTYPFIAVHSIPCGYTIFFSAVMMGIVAPYSPKA